MMAGGDLLELSCGLLAAPGPLVFGAHADEFAFDSDTAVENALLYDNAETFPVDLTTEGQ